MFPFFYCSINVTVTSQSDVPSFLMNQTAFYQLVLCAPKIIKFSVVYCVVVVKNAIGGPK